MSEGTAPSPAQAAKSEAAKQAVILVFGIATLLIAMALMHPDSLRTLRMRTAAKSGRVLARLSREAGRVSMRTELRTGRQEYTIPYHLSMLRDRMASAYRRSSGAS